MHSDHTNAERYTMVRESIACDSACLTNTTVVVWVLTLSYSLQNDRANGVHRFKSTRACNSADTLLPWVLNEVVLVEVQ